MVQYLLLRYVGHIQYCTLTTPFGRKYFGYHAFASYLASSDDAFVLRRFDNLHCRILLRLQDQLTEHEEELNLIDAEFSEKSAKDVDNGSFRNDQKKRRDVLEAILAKLEQYGMSSPPSNSLKGLNLSALTADPE